MPNENKAVDEFLDGLNKSEENPFDNKNEDPFKEPLVEKQEAADDETEEKPLPFHKDPKVQRYVEKQIAKAIALVKPTEVERFREDTHGQDDEVTAVLERIIGNDTPEKAAAVKDFRKVLGSLEERGAQKALQHFAEQAQERAEEDRKAQQELDDSFEEIEETYNVDLTSNTASAKRMRSEFVDYIRKIAPKNEDGEVVAYPDLSAAFEEYQEKRKPAPSRAKELAARGMSRSTDATAAPKTGGNSWKDVERIFSRLS